MGARIVRPHARHVVGRARALAPYLSLLIIGGSVIVAIVVITTTTTAAAAAARRTGRAVGQRVQDLRALVPFGLLRVFVILDTRVVAIVVVATHGAARRGPAA